MLFRDLTQTSLRGAIFGFVEGALIVCVVLVNSYLHIHAFV